MSTDARARIIIEAVTQQAQQNMQALGRSMGTITGQAQAGSRSWVQSLGDIRTSTIAAMGAVTVAVVAARKAYAATVGEAMSYAREIRQLSTITGQTAEATSRVVQVFGDFNIETSQVTAAMRIMRQQGLVPTMDSIADLSDRYLALAPGIARVNFLQETFGRGGAEFAAVLEQGSTALRERAATVESGLVLTRQQLDQAEELRLAQDDLRDSFRSVAVTLGMLTIPALASWTGELVRNITTTRDAIDPAEELGRRFGGVAGYAAAMEQPTLREAFAIRDLEDAINGLPASHTTAITADTTQANQVLDDFMARLATAGMWSVSGTGGFSMGAGGRTVIGGGGGGGGGGLTASQQATNTWRTSHGYSAWTGAQFSAAGMASGGPLGRGWTLVGELGQELITPDRVVIPHSETQRLLQSGLMPERRAASGDDFGLRPVASYVHAQQRRQWVVATHAGWYNTPGAGETPMGGTATSAAQAAVTAAVTQAAVQEANAPMEAALAVMPQALGAQIIEPMRTQANAITKSNNELAGLLQDIRLLLTRQATDGGIGRAVRDNMQAAG